MLPLAHIFISTKVTKRKAPLLVFGSVLPDISWTSESEIGRDQIHHAPQKLYDFISQKYPQLVDLALGVKLHSNVDKGADYYSDDMEVGFAKIEGRKIEDDAADLLKEEKSEKTLVLAHNFIEAAVDVILSEEKPELLKLYKDSMNSVDLDEISACLGEYLSLDKKVVRGEIERFLKFVGPTAYTSKESLIDRLLILVKQRRGKDVNRDQTEKLLEKAIILMRGKHTSYLDNAIKNMKEDFSKIINS